MVGPFWVVEDRGSAALIALAVPLEQADPYGDMLTVDTGHFEYWSDWRAAAPGPCAKPAFRRRRSGPNTRNGRVVGCSTIAAARCFVIRADRQLHRPAFVRLIADRFRIATEDAMILPDDHYRSVRRVPQQASNLCS